VAHRYRVGFRVELSKFELLPAKSLSNFGERSFTLPVSVCTQGGVVQSPIKLTQDYREFWFHFCSLRVDMNFIFECSTRYRVEQSKIKFISTSGHVILLLITMFLTTFRRFPKIFQNCSEGLTNVSEHFLTFLPRLPKIAEDFRGGTDDVSIIQHHLWVLFKCSYSNDSLKTCDNNLIFLHVKILYFYMWKYMDFLSGRNPNKPLVFI